MNNNTTIEEFDTKISEFVERLKTDLIDITFNREEGIKFINSTELDSKKLFAHKKVKGVYLFELNLDSQNLIGKKRGTQINNFADAWAKKKNYSFLMGG